MKNIEDDNMSERISEVLEAAAHNLELRSFVRRTPRQLYFLILQWLCGKSNVWQTLLRPRYRRQVD